MGKTFLLMGTTAQFIYKIRCLYLYQQERFKLSLFIPLALYLTVIGLSISPLELTPTQYLSSLVLCIILLFLFRLWDDLFDLNFDRVHHPDRILTKQFNLSVFWKFSLLLLLLSFFLIRIQAGQYHNAIGFLIFCLIYFIVVSHLSPKFRRIPGLHQLPLLKYPIYLLFINPHLGGANKFVITHQWTCLVAVFFVAGIYEVMHDKDYFSCSVHKAIMVVEYVVLLVFLAWRNVQISIISIKFLALSFNFIGLIIIIFIVLKIKDFASIQKMKYTPFFLLFLGIVLWLVNNQMLTIS